MKSHIKNLLLILILAAETAIPAIGQTPSSAVPDGLEKGYFVFQSFPLDASTQGVDGTLQLLLDIRLSKREDPSRRNDDERDPSDKKIPDYKPALLRILRKDGKMPERSEWLKGKVDDPFWVSVEQKNLGTGQKIYVADIDHEIGWTPGQGENYWLFVVENGHVTPLEAADSKTGKMKEIRIVQTLVGNYEYTPSIYGKGQQDILSIFSIGDETTYERYCYESGRWVVHVRTEPHNTYMMEDSPFPEAESHFWKPSK